jgi:hypothetical protein
VAHAIQRHPCFGCSIKRKKRQQPKGPQGPRQRRKAKRKCAGDATEKDLDSGARAAGFERSTPTTGPAPSPVTREMNRNVQKGACGCHAIRTERNREKEEEMFDDWTAGYRAGKRVFGMGKGLARMGKAWFCRL